MGRRASDAEAQRILIGKQQSAKAPAADADLTVLELPDRKTLSDSADVYVKQKADANLSEAEMQARSVTAEFLRGTKKQFVDEITTEDITKFHAALRKRGCEPRTVANKHQRLVSWLKSAGVDPKLFPKRPVYEKTLPTIYNSEQIKRLLSDRNPYMHMAMLLALKLGLRDQELRHVEFSDIDEAERTLRVRGKPKWRFHVKAYQQRDIPIPDDLFDELMTWKKKYPKQNLILATRNGNPNTKLLLALKGGARRTKLRCGRCVGCIERKECENFTLHHFRRTYITNLLRNGVDLRTVQAFAGHKDLASTMRYLRPAAAAEARVKINTVKW